MDKGQRNIIFFDDEHRSGLLPLTYNRPIAELRIGIFTIKEKWEKILDGSASHITQEYLSPKYPIKIAKDNLVICGRLLPSEKLLWHINKLHLNEAILFNSQLMAARIDDVQFNRIIANEDVSELDGTDLESMPDAIHLIERPYDIFSLNGEEIVNDLDIIKKHRFSEQIPNSVLTTGNDIFIEKGAVLENCTINSTDGPVYIGANAKVLEGAMIRGPFALCEHAVVKMGAKMYKDTTIGPYSKVGGEISNSVLLGYANKGHDGYLGNSVIGEWCNLGADTNNSNLKNNYDQVKLWNYQTDKFEKSGLQFCGLIMGDHSKCGINTMFNTGTTVGYFCNIYGSGYPRNFIPSFSWGGPSGYQTYQLEKAFDTAERVMIRRDIHLSDLDKNILRQIFEESEKYR